MEVIDPGARDRRLDELLQQYHKGQRNRVLVFVLYKKEAARVEAMLQRKAWNVRARRRASCCTPLRLFIILDFMFNLAVDPQLLSKPLSLSKCPPWQRSQPRLKLERNWGCKRLQLLLRMCAVLLHAGLFRTTYRYHNQGNTGGVHAVHGCAWQVHAGLNQRTLTPRQQRECMQCAAVHAGPVRTDADVQGVRTQCAAVHGDISQSARSAAVDGFKSGGVPLLIATDVAARGLDIPDVAAVINYSFPLTTEDYVHRIGRTGRAGKSGAHVVSTRSSLHHIRRMPSLLALLLPGLRACEWGARYRLASCFRRCMHASGGSWVCEEGHHACKRDVQSRRCSGKGVKAALLNAGVSHTFFSGQTDKARAGELINVLREAGQMVPAELLAFGTTVKKKESKLYGAHFKELDHSRKATKVSFDSDDE